MPAGLGAAIPLTLWHSRLSLFRALAADANAVKIFGIQFHIDDNDAPHITNKD
jgi:hypothetical protein